MTIQHTGRILRLIVVLAVSASTVDAAENAPPARIVVVQGTGGQSEYTKLFQAWTQRWIQIAKQGNAELLRVGGSERNEDSPVRSQLEQKLKSVVGAEIPLWVVLIGHGTFDGESAKFNVDGPDLTAAESGTDGDRQLQLIQFAIY